jgi:hypothetical protein
MLIIKTSENTTMPKAAKRGRPPKPARLKRTRRLQLLLTTTEHKALNKHAARHEMTASELVRACIRALLKDGRS